MSFTTVDNVRLFLGKETLSPAEELTVEMLIELIDGVIMDYCGWEMLARDYTDKFFDGTGTDMLNLGVYPINTLTSVNDTSADTDITGSLRVNNEEGTLLFPASSGTFTSGKQNISVTFNAGYEAEKIPKQLVYAANYLVVINYNRILTGTIGMLEERFNGIVAKYDSEDMPAVVKRVLDRHRKVLIF
jgi:hypothetical protein